MKSKVVGNIPIADDIPTSELPVKDSLDQARRVFKKGRMEWMGGPIYYLQDGADHNNRECLYAYPMGMRVDPMAHDLGVDETEQ